MGKSQGTPLLAAVGNGPASPAYGCVKPRLAFSLEFPLDESGGQAREIKLKSLPSEAPGRFTIISTDYNLLTMFGLEFVGERISFIESKGRSDDKVK